MKINLKKITDKTIQELLQNEIILPSSYFESFNQNAKDLNVDVTDKNFEKEISQVLVDEFKNINEYTKRTISNIDLLSKATMEARDAIKTKDETKLHSINNSLDSMKKEIDSLKNLIYIDSLTHSFNRKWIYTQSIKEDGKFGYEGILLFIDINDFSYIIDNYGNLIADNVIIYISKFLNAKFKKEKFNFKISRYSNDQFILFIQEKELSTVISFINSYRLELSNSLLKSKSGITFKTNFNFGAVKFHENDEFQQTLEVAFNLSQEDKEKINS